MSDTAVVEIVLAAIIVTAKVSAPILIVSLVVGLAVSLVQAVTQIQEATLAFVPKLVAVAVVIVVAGNWMLGQVVAFTRDLFDTLPRLVGGG